MNTLQQHNYKMTLPPSVFEQGIDIYGSEFGDFFEPYVHPWDKFGWNEEEAKQRIADRFNLT